VPTWRNEIEKEFGESVYHSGFAGDVIDSGSFIVNFLTGIGGYPFGHVVELFGEEGSGKTTLVLAVIKVALDEGRPVLFEDYECTVSDAYLVRLGIDPKKLRDYRITPASMEDGFMMQKRFCEKYQNGLIVTDSIAAMPPMGDVEKMAKVIGHVQVASAAQVMSITMKQMTNVFKKSNNCAIFVNQERSLIDTVRGLAGRKTTPGGAAVKFFSALRMKTRMAGAYRQEVEDSLTGQKDDRAVEGINVWVEVVKNKFSRSYTKGKILIRMDGGVDNVFSAINVGIRIGFIEKKGSWYHLHEEYSGETLGRLKKQGIEQVRQYFLNNPESWSKFYKDIQDFLSKR